MAMALGMKSITGDAHFFEESMNLDRIRKLLDNKLGVAGHGEKLEAMKALLASISKGEDVSAFFADVVKNVIVASVEVKKLVYMYLVHYADANSQCRELALLSINSFQKDLADPNQLIRALALRVMTSIRVRDILQIQLLAIRKCAADESAYVRKCATNAISKVFVVDPEQKDVLADIIGTLLNDASTMVLGSAVQALNEVCPDRLDLLHRPFRKLCHLLADIDEWGQTATLNVLIRYCREQFQAPQVMKEETGKEKFPKRKTRRGFYSDDEGSESEGDEKTAFKKSQGGASQSPFMLGGGAVRGEALPSIGSVFRSDALASGIGGGEELDEDHRLLLRSSIPLLKSRNSAVVLAVATLHYYCGTHSMATSTLIGKSLVRIMRNQREIQYVVLSVISSMATSRPDMFRPFLQEFFVRATDPAYARKLKLEILTSLVTDDNVSIILREFQAYVRHVDKSFVTMTVRALGRVADAMPSVAERCLSGLMRLVRSSNEQVVAESVVVIRQLLQQQAIKKDRLVVVRSLAAMMVTGRVTSPSARASIVWMLGEFNDDGNGTTYAAESLRLLVKDFSDESTEVRLQVLNLAVKLGLREPQKRTIQLLLQYVIELCKFDIDYDVRDRARLVRAALSGDASIVNPHKLFASKKPAPLIGYDDEIKTRFSLGTMSNVVRHRVPGYLVLPEWRSTKPDRSLRDESSFVETNRGGSSRHAPKVNKKKEGRAKGFYSDESSSGSESSESESESESEAESGSGSDYDSDSGSSDGSGSGSESASSNSASESEASSSEESESEVSSEEEERPRRRQKGGKTKSPQKQSQPKKTKPTNAFDPLDLLGSPTVNPAAAPSMQAFASMDHAMAPTSNLLGDLMSLSVSSSTTPPPRHELLSSLAGNGLDVHYAFLRQPSTHSPGMNVIQLWFANNSSEPISRVQVVGKNPQQVVPFPELPVLFPGGSTSMAQLHVDFLGRLDNVPLEIVTSEDKYEVDLFPVVGELFLPQQTSLEEFERRISMTDSTSLHTSEFTLPVPVQMNSVVQAVFKDCNVAQVYEINNMNGVVGKCKFAGRFRSGNTSAENVLIGLEVQLQTGKGRLLVVMRDSVLAQRLTTGIKRAMPLQA
ncbi:AP-3 complex subunit beta-1 [Phytophthora rubi]|uniref:AP-3 complex subunit beta n=1 Tax=Phytophthora rubi TaxID=129364 RepID=A0A6A4EGW1_9STRA|nr:AP-3 complex subunit beta-1 [Phytophthora rubi]KAE9012642.1 AP-3 complex subunit beta-1 [Phytophthora rubi]KAE9325841.1 AP-3 complex subunit beta-1 [Phytophthora rubi]